MIGLEEDAVDAVGVELFMHIESFDDDDEERDDDDDEDVEFELFKH